MTAKHLAGLPLAVVLLAVAGCEEETPRAFTAEGPIRVGASAPDFTLPAAAGGQVSLSDLRGRPVLLYFSMGPG